MKKVDSQAVWQTFLANLTMQGCNIVTGVLTARMLQPEGRGELAAVILWPSIMAPLGILGTNWALAREAAARPEDEANLVWSGVILGLLQAMLFMALGYFLIPQLLPKDKQHLATLTQIYLLLLPMNFISLNLIALDQGRLRWRNYNLLRLTVVLPYLAFLICFWWAKINQVSWFILAMLVSNFVTMISCLLIKRQELHKGKISLSDACRLLKLGFPFFLAAVGGVIALQIDKALVVSLLSSEAVGCYAAAITFASAHAALGGALGITSFAALANEADPHGQGEYLAKVFRQGSLLYLGASGAVALLAPLFIVPLFGLPFAPAVVPASILALATSLVALGQILNEGLRGRGNTYPGIAAQLLGGGMVAMGAWAWIARYGLIGMAWAAVCGSLVQLLVLIAAVITLLPIRPAQLWGLRPVEVKILYGRLLSFLPFNGTLLKGWR